MKNDRMQKIRGYLPGLQMLLEIDGAAALILWLADLDAFRILLPLFLTVTFVIFGVHTWGMEQTRRKRHEAYLEFLASPDEWQEENLIRIAPADRELIRTMGTLLRDHQEKCSLAAAETRDYEEYVEVWAHEIKAPLFLLTMVLDNQREEFPESAGYKLDYVRSRIQEQVGQMLYYARLKSPCRDYLFEAVDLGVCVEEILEDYRPLLEERKFQIKKYMENAAVYTDLRGITFLLGQVIANAVKYCSSKPELIFLMEQKDSGKVLRIRDNGIGVKACDLPYLFEKGFTGDTQDGRKKATGMGLYLAAKMADDLKIRLEAVSEAGKGFEMILYFPKVDQT